MKNKPWTLRRITGLVFIIVAAISLVIDLAGVIQIWVLRDPVTRDAITTLDLLNSTLDTTSQGLGIAKTSLKSVTATIGTLKTTVNSTAATIGNASTAVGSVGSIIGSKLTGTVTSAVGTLQAVQDTAQTIDNVLSSLSQIPLIGIKYDPEKSLSASVSELRAKVDQVPESLSELETNLATSGSSLNQVGQDASLLAANLGQVESDLGKLVGVIEQYETQVKAFQGTVRNLRENIVTIVWGVVLFLTFILAWLGAVMVQTLWRGLEWMGYRPTWFDEPVTSQ